MNRSSPEEAWEIGKRVWLPGDSGPLHCAVLFVDLVNSTDFAGVMALEEYAAFSRAFRSTCLEQCRHFFETRYRRREYRHDGRDYEIESVGDELCVMVHSDKRHDDVYQLICLAIALKCAWLGSRPNAERVASGRPAVELAAGIHSGPVWATRGAGGFERSGFAIQLAKRVESESRRGERFRIFVSDPAFKLVNRRMRNLIFGPRQLADLKGVSAPIGLYEVVESFVDPTRRMAPHLHKAFEEAAHAALATNSFDLWIHSCIQVAEGARRNVPGDDALELCRQVLEIDPRNAVALFYSAEGALAQGKGEMALLYLEDLTRFWPSFGDGWLAMGRLLKEIGESGKARRCLLQARRFGVGEEEETLPPAS